MVIETWLAFSLASAILLVIPGPTILTVVAYSIANGRSAALPLILAVALADATALTLSVLGLGTLLAKSAVLFQAVKLLGGCYLLFLGVQMIRNALNRKPLPVVSDQTATKKMFSNTYLVTALNPKGIVFFIAFLPQFIDRSEAVNPQMVILGLTFVCLAAINTAMYVFFADRARVYLSTDRTQRRFQFLGGGLLSGAGLWAMLSR